MAQPILPIDRILAAAPVIPVLAVERADDAVPIAEALVAGGLPVVEVTLRTPAALESIRAMRDVPGVTVGAGTVLDRTMLDAAIDAGAEFIVSPGLTESLCEAAARAGAPYLPGTATASEVMRARDLGLSRLKFFPAEASGGIPALEALAAVFADMIFCPTGGIRAGNAGAWLELPSVACVGGTWLAPAGEAVDPEAIRRRAAAAASLRPAS